jgi:phosphonatase-like hydrolase
MNSAITLAVLDMAGTTIDVADGVPEALQDAFAAFDLSLSREAIVHMRGRSKREAIRTMLQGFPPPADGGDLSGHIYEIFRTTLRERYSRSAKPVAGATETIGWLRSRNIAVVLTTGFDRDLALLLLEKAGWGDDLVSGVVTSDDVSRGRPEPDMIFRAMNMLAVDDASRVLVVGDTTADLESGKRAGAALIAGVLSGAHSRAELEAHEHDVLLDSIADLPTWLEHQEPWTTRTISMHHTVTVRWQRGAHEPFVDGKYLRKHFWKFDGGVEVPASASPHVVPMPFSDPSGIDPEEAFVASLSSCHMLFVLSIAASRKLLVESYVDNAEGILEKDGNGRLAMTRVTLRPRVTFGETTRVSGEQLGEIHHLAHEKCFIANSVKTVVTVEPC